MKYRIIEKNEDISKTFWPQKSLFGLFYFRIKCGEFGAIWKQNLYYTNSIEDAKRIIENKKPNITIKKHYL